MRKQKQYTWSVSSRPMATDEEQAFVPLLDRMIEEMVKIAMADLVTTAPLSVEGSHPDFLRVDDAQVRRRVSDVAVPESSETASATCKETTQ